MEHEHYSHTHDAVSPQETLALLQYMARHNAHHAEELLEAARSLPQKAASPVYEAVELLKQSTDKILQPIGRLEE